MLSQLRAWLANIFTPLAVIAKEMTTMRELYELDLAQRNIYRITEAPGKNDTQVFYSDQPVKVRTALQKAMAETMGEAEENDDYYEDEDDDE
jgi:hypothetical protein